MADGDAYNPQAVWASYDPNQGYAPPSSAAPQDPQALLRAKLASAGYSPQAISGIAYNVGRESGWDSTLRHPDQPHFGGEAHYAHGLFQEGGDEWNRYQQGLNGRDWRDPGNQIDYVVSRLQSPDYAHTQAGLQNAQTPEQAASVFMNGYLRPASWAAASRQQDINKGIGDGFNVPSHPYTPGTPSGAPMADQNNAGSGSDPMSSAFSQMASQPSSGLSGIDKAAIYLMSISNPQALSALGSANRDAEMRNQMMMHMMTMAQTQRHFDAQMALHQQDQARADKRVDQADQRLGIQQAPKDLYGRPILPGSGGGGLPQAAPGPQASLPTPPSMPSMGGDQGGGLPQPPSMPSSAPVQAADAGDSGSMPSLPTPPSMPPAQMPMQTPPPAPQVAQAAPGMPQGSYDVASNGPTPAPTQSNAVASQQAPHPVAFSENNMRTEGDFDHAAHQLRTAIGNGMDPQEALKYVDPAYQSIIKDWREGSYNPDARGGGGKGQYGPDVLQGGKLAAAIYGETPISEAYKYRQSLNDRNNNSLGGQLKSFQTLMGPQGHVADLIDAAGKSNNFDDVINPYTSQEHGIKGANAGASAGAGVGIGANAHFYMPASTEQDALQALNVMEAGKTANAQNSTALKSLNTKVGGELVNAITGGKGGEEDRRIFEQTTADPTNTRGQNYAGIKSSIDMMQGRVDAATETLKRIYGGDTEGLQRALDRDGWTKLQGNIDERKAQLDRVLGPESKPQRIVDYNTGQEATPQAIIDYHSGKTSGPKLPDVSSAFIPQMFQSGTGPGNTRNPNHTGMGLPSVSPLDVLRRLGVM